MKKLGTFIIIVFISIALAAIYGVTHDFITSKISPEFYTKLIFFNFGILDDYAREFNGNWTFSLIWVGFFSTWWFGLLTGIVLGIFGLKYSDRQIMLNKSLKSIFIVIGITILFGFVGYGIAELNPSEIIANYDLPFEIEHKAEFNKVAKIHNFSYFGGIFGLIIGTLNQIKN
ncbi:hypothetical protein DIS18_12445 [Algibacter marinivivus]|uniref:Signal peptide-containing protein n=1 Tax=Algibacter marinivivus TaxID=2100723 RepID=A0A2U2X2Q4_9FLAO|nr:hypothetical protein [Algibacter marinivivus]PWH82068.1 hypothetical protein DIS18_12445 [Algibacter marinivivus]